MINSPPIAIPDVVCDFGWRYGIQPLSSQATIISKNEVHNPSFEYDTLGTAPAGMTNTGSMPTFTVQNGWAKGGTNSLRITTITLTTGNQTNPECQGPVLIPGIGSGWPVVPGQKWAARADLNVLAAAGTPYAGLEFETYKTDGTFVGAVNVALINPATVGEHAVSGVWTIPTDSAYLNVSVVVGANAPATTVDFYIDRILFARSDPVPNYADGDNAGWSWTGAPGNSASIDQKDFPMPTPTPLQQIITFDAIDSQLLNTPKTITPSGVTIVDYRWDFGNGQIGRGPYATTTYTYNKPPPDLKASLTVTDSHNRTYSCSKPVNLQALTPLYGTTVRERG